MSTLPNSPATPITPRSRTTASRDTRVAARPHPGRFARVTWFHQTRLKVLAYVLGITLAGLGLLSLTTIPAWPVVGVIVAAAAMVINTAASRLSDPTCLGCGRDLAGQPTAEHGIACPDCGSISFKPGSLASAQAATSPDLAADATADPASDANPDIDHAEAAPGDDSRAA